MPEILDDFRDYLITQSVVRRPSSATPDAHPLYLEPQGGAPMAGDKTGVEADAVAVLSAFDTGDFPEAFYSEWRRSTIDVHIRVKSLQSLPEVRVIERQLRDALLGDAGAKFNWQMGSRQVIESSQWRGLQRLGADAQGWTYVAAYLFQTYA